MMEWLRECGDLRHELAGVTSGELEHARKDLLRKSNPPRLMLMAACTQRTEHRDERVTCLERFKIFAGFVKCIVVRSNGSKERALIKMLQKVCFS